MITVDEKNNTVNVPSAYLASFARTRRGRTRLLFSQCEDEREWESFGHPLSQTVEEKGVSFKIMGRADGVFQSGNEFYMVKSFETGRVTGRTSPASHPMAMAETVLSAHMLCLEKGASGVHMYITFYSGSTTKSFEAYAAAAFLKNMSDVLFERALPFIEIEVEKQTVGQRDLKKLPFPYPNIREAQEEFIKSSFRAFKRGERLLVCAPTGVGKTVSALYPALRAVGEGLCKKVFYLTAKTVTGNAAADAVRIMAQNAPALKCVTVLAKERLCPMADTVKTEKTGKCRLCPLMGEVGRVPYEERRDAALYELLSHNKVIDTRAVCAAAKKHELCPYELSLDVSEYAEVVICDYNYVFNPSVRFKRYFEKSGENEYIFLIDEAHNLPDRAREMYSARLNCAEILKVYSRIKDEANIPPALRAGCVEAVKELKKIYSLCGEEAREMPDGKTAGYYISSQIPPGLTDALVQFSASATSFERECGDDEDFLSLAVESAREFLRSAALFDKGFTFYAELYGGSLSVSLRCLDPAPLLDRMMCSARSAVLFSATLTPMDYFADVLGSPKAEQIELVSPYAPENLCLFAVDSVSTRYSDRESFAEDAAEIIASVIEAREGNYMVYFPSYEYMRTVYKAFCEMGCDAETAVQARGMSHEMRNAFLDKFKSKKSGTLVGFCVLGGAFSEGVDLKGERLIGTVIIGTGLPKITAEQNILRDYFDTTTEKGYEYAYVYPAMIKVQQAVGRVIRGETDKGVAVLVDDRYGDPSLYRLFPRSWRHIKYTSDPFTLATALERFWEEQ